MASHCCASCLVPGGRAWVELKSAASRVQPRHSSSCLMHGCAGVPGLPTDGGRCSPFALGEDVEPMAGNSVVGGLAAA